MHYEAAAAVAALVLDDAQAPGFVCDPLRRPAGGAMLAEAARTPNPR
jgi:hypothetical protein